MVCKRNVFLAVKNKIKKILESSILISGGDDWKIIKNSTKELAFNDCYIRKFQTIGTTSEKITVSPTSWNQGIGDHYLLFNNQEELMMFRKDKCMILKYGHWVEHSSYNAKRNTRSSLIIQMPGAIFLFGKASSTFRKFERTYEYLPNGSHSWNLVKLPEGEDFNFWCSFGLAISANELLVMGGINPSDATNPLEPRRKIMKLNTHDNSWMHFGNLRVGRKNANAVIFNNRIIISGGRINHELTSLRSTEILTLQKTKSHQTELQHTHYVDIKDGGDTAFSRLGKLCMGLIHVENKTRLIMFGGESPIEEWDEETESWQRSNLSPPTVHSSFGYCYISQSLNFQNCSLK